MTDPVPVTDLRSCARCGQDHAKLVFHPFTQGPCGQNTHWALCPTNGEPILMRIVDDTKPLRAGDLGERFEMGPDGMMRAVWPQESLLARAGVGEGGPVLVRSRARLGL